MASEPISPAAKMVLLIAAFIAVVLAGLAFVTPVKTGLVLLLVAMAMSFSVNKLVTNDDQSSIHIKHVGIYLLARATLFASFLSLARLAVISF